jgi:hypothetical protein
MMVIAYCDFKVQEWRSYLSSSYSLSGELAYWHRE